MRRAISQILFHSGELKSVKRVYSFPNAIAQCRKWLESHLPRFRSMIASTADAAVQATLDRRGRHRLELAGRIIIENGGTGMKIRRTTQGFCSSPSSALPYGGDRRRSFFRQGQVGALKNASALKGNSIDQDWNPADQEKKSVEYISSVDLSAPSEKKTRARGRFSPQGPCRRLKYGPYPTAPSCIPRSGIQS